jgi:hypothetical protein
VALMAIDHNDAAGFLQIRVDHDQLDRLIHSVLSPTAMKRVQVRAINETTAWLKGRLLRELPGLTGIPRKILRPRIRASKAKTRLNNVVSGMVWLGIKPVDAWALGEGEEASTGYQTGGFYFEGGFKAFYKTRTGGVGIFARTGRGRTPIKRQNVKIDNFVNQSVRRMIPQAEHQLTQKMTRLVSHELEQATR